jgi:hypothetical protein
MSLRIGLLALLFLAGCGGGGAQSGPGPWQKAGASEQTTALDSTDCRSMARAEALRQYPYRGSPSLGAGGAVVGQQADDTGRAIVEQAQFNDCMKAKGYQQPGR